MALGDIRIVSNGGRNVTPSRSYQVAASATLILPGEPVKLSAAGSQYVIKLADAEPVVGTTTEMLGIAQSTSTNTAGADGVVEVAIAVPGTIYRARAKSAAAIDTQAELNALIGNQVVFDLTSGVFTVDESAAHGATNGIQILGGDPVSAEIDFTIRSGASLFY